MRFPQKLIFRVHAIKRMFERNITIEDIRVALVHVQIVKEYEEDKPYPSYLILGWCEKRPIHIVCAVNIDAQETIIITAYEPALEEWNDEFRVRRKNL